MDCLAHPLGCAYVNLETTVLEYLPLLTFRRLKTWRKDCVRETGEIGDINGKPFCSK